MAGRFSSRAVVGGSRRENFRSIAGNANGAFAARRE
jgi:hypothetical protein